MNHGAGRPAAAARPRAARDQPVPRREPRHRQSAGVRRPGARAGAHGGQPHGRCGARRCIRCMRISCAAAISTRRSSTKWTAAVDGASFTNRRVVAIQHGKQIFHLSASFQLPEAGSRSPGPGARRHAARRLARPHGDSTQAARRNAGAGAALLVARAAVRVPLRRVDPGWQAATGRAPRLVPARPSLAASTTRCCSAACWRMSRISPARRPRRCRTACRTAPATCCSRASTTPCGSIGRSGSTTGCFTR